MGKSLLIQGRSQKNFAGQAFSRMAYGFGHPTWSSFKGADFQNGLSTYFLLKIILLQVPLKMEDIKTPNLTSVLRIPILVPVLSPTKMLRDTNNF